MKFKVLNEFEKKNEEIKSLKEMLKRQNKENAELKKLVKNDKIEPNDLYFENDQLRNRISQAIDICSDLALNTERLIQMNSKHDNKNKDMLNSSQACLNKASRFLAGMLFYIHVF